jgi:hypothetical protein
MFQNKENMLKMDLKVIACKFVNRIQLAQDGDRWRALVSTAIDLRVS